MLADRQKATRERRTREFEAPKFGGKGDKNVRTKLAKALVNLKKKGIKEEFVDEARSAGYKMPQRSNETEGNFEVKWATNKKGPIQVAKGFKTHTDAKDWLAAQQKDDKRIKGIVVNKDFKIDRKRKTRKEEVEEAYKTPAEKKAERLAKIARASAAREKGQAKEKEKATAKHNKASAKSREAIKYRGNKDQFGRVREEEDIDEISRKKMTQYVKGASDDLERKAHNLGKARGRGGDYPDPRGGDHELARQSGMDRLKRQVKNRKAGISRAVGKLAKEERKPYPPPGWKIKKSHQSTVAHDATKKYTEKSGYADDIKRDKPKNVIAYVARRKREEREKKTNEGYGGLSKAEYEKAKAKPPKQTKKTPPATPTSTSRVLARAIKRSKKPSQRLTSGFRSESMIGRTKPSRELNVSREEKPYLAGKSSLKDKKRAAHKAERAKAKKKLKQPVSEAKRKMGNVKDVPVYREIEGKKGHHEVIGHVHRSAKSVGAAKLGNAATARQTTKLKGPEFPEGPGWIVQDKLR